MERLIYLMKEGTLCSHRAHQRYPDFGEARALCCFRPTFQVAQLTEDNYIELYFFVAYFTRKIDILVVLLQATEEY